MWDELSEAGRDEALRGLETGKAGLDPSGLDYSTEEGLADASPEALAARARAEGVSPLAALRALRW